MRLPIRVRMTAWYAALLAVIIASVGTFLVVRLRTDLTETIDRSLSASSDQIALGYRAEGAPEARDVAATTLSGDDAAAQVLEPAPHVVASYGNAVARTPMLTAGEQGRVLSGERLVRTTELGTSHERFRLIALPTTSRRGNPAIVVAAESMSTVDRSVHRVRVLLLIAGPAALLATLLGGWWLARRALLPVEHLTTEAREIGMNRLDGRLAVPATGDEIARLATTLNTMLARIQSGVLEQQRLVADASHELRSPLAVMRAELDVSLHADDLGPQARDVLLSTRAEVDHMSRTVDDLLTLARADDGGMALEVEPVDLGQVALATAGAMRGLARSRSIDVRVDAASAAAVGDTQRLRQAVGNLVDNAIRYSPDGATVLIRTRSVGDDAVVHVDDDGPGVPAEMRERVFDRFVRLDASRARATGGSGIGLAIVREIALAHGGRAWVEPRARGGSTFSIALPGAGDPHPPPEARRTRQPPP